MLFIPHNIAAKNSKISYQTRAIKFCSATISYSMYQLCTVVVIHIYLECTTSYTLPVGWFTSPVKRLIDIPANTPSFGRSLHVFISPKSPSAEIEISVFLPLSKNIFARLIMIRLRHSIIPDQMTGSSTSPASEPRHKYARIRHIMLADDAVVATPTQQELLSLVNL